ncbi:peptide ABC transporter permease, partial [Pseudomonas aeruginosa]
APRRPRALLTVFFTGTLLIEVLYSLDGLGLMGYEAALGRDYPVVLGSLFIFTQLGLLVKLARDQAKTLVAPPHDKA